MSVLIQVIRQRAEWIESRKRADVARARWSRAGFAMFLVMASLAAWICRAAIIGMMSTLVLK